MKISRHSSYYLKIISFLILFPFIPNYITQHHPPQNPCHLKQDREARTTENVTNQDEDHLMNHH